jgi:hypothetical protein
MSPVARAHVIVSVIVLAAAAVLIAVMVTVVDSPRARATPSECREAIVDSGLAQAALDLARPGSRVCLSGNGLSLAELTLTVSGTQDEPIVVSGDNAVLRGLDVQADHVVVEGLNFVDGSGLTLQGEGHVVRDNLLRGATSDGILCEPCTDAVIERNTVDATEGRGIGIDGVRFALRDNTVTGSVKKAAGDADGIRFFGTALRITGNTVRDIKDDYPGLSEEERPHTDCFQTFDDDSPTTYDVLISQNVCTNVDAQCLIGTANERGNAGVPAGVRSIIFEGNRCDVEGSQAVYLERYGNVEVRDNELLGDFLYAGVKAQDDSGDVAVIDNRVQVGVPPFEVDYSSMSGFVESGNAAIG